MSADHADYVRVRRDALEALIEDVRAIARCTGPDGSMVYARLMKKVHAVETSIKTESGGSGQ